MKSLFFILLMALGVLLPELALAETLKPASGTDWDLFVFGNGYVVKEILTGVTLLMTGGDGAFVNLLLLLATLGFLALAIAAGFDPGKNLMRMFTYIIVVWMVQYGSTRLTVNVVITDMVRTENSTGTNEYRLTGVPALVGLPAALTSQVGVRFTEFIETYFSQIVGPEFTLSGSGGGQFNLFNKMIQESDQYVFTIPELKQSVSSYMNNCVVPAIALGRLESADGCDKCKGASAITSTTNFLGMLGTASSPSLLTQYYPIAGENGEYDTTKLGALSEMSGVDVGAAVASSGNMGVMLTCAGAYSMLQADMDQWASAMVSKGSESWAKSGVMVPFEETMSAALGKASAAGSVSANFSRPSGFIMQQAFLNAKAGAFRNSAIQTGNNELMQAAAISQAEQQQKSAWVAGFAVFNNMMGYVYTVLQAFIFAITPIIIIALLIPGMGKSIFTNYAQILIWLTMWQPMLAIINFILTLFGSSAFADSIGANGGLSENNKGIISERANDLVIAAQFLGTMVPLLTWGIVKGAMAFTEFISSGVGSSFANPAGSAAATGNLSMNNMSMGNTSMDKYNTMASSAVGTQSIQVGASAGAMMVEQATGGTSTMVNGKAADLGQSLSKSAQAGISYGKDVAKEASAASTEQLSMADLVNRAADTSKSSAQRNTYTQALAKSIQASTGISAGGSLALANAAVNNTNASADRKLNLSDDVKVGAGLPGIAKQVLPISADFNRSGSNSLNNSMGTGAQNSKGVTESMVVELGKLGLSESDSKQFVSALNRESATSSSQSAGASHNESATVSKALSEVKKEGEKYAESMSASLSRIESLSYSQETDMAQWNQVREQMMAATAHMPGADTLRAGMADMQRDVDNAQTTLGADFKSHQQAYQGELATRQGQSGQFGPPAATKAPTSSVDSNIMKMRADLNDRIKSAQVDAREVRTDNARQLANGPKSMHVPGDVLSPEEAKNPRVHQTNPEGLGSRVETLFGK